MSTKKKETLQHDMGQSPISGGDSQLLLHMLGMFLKCQLHALGVVTTVVKSGNLLRSIGVANNIYCVTYACISIHIHLRDSSLI